MDEGKPFRTVVFKNLVVKKLVFKNFKERGESVELRFMAQAMGLGLRVSKPWGDSSAYDVGVESGSRIPRVQVKSTTNRMGSGYLCRLKPNPASAPYREEQLDFFAAYVIPEDVWYVIPAGVVLRGRGDLMLCPVQARKYDRCRYEHYREASRPLRPEQKQTRMGKRK
jgi:hypothetical protein